MGRISSAIVCALVLSGCGGGAGGAGARDTVDDDDATAGADDDDASADDDDAGESGGETDGGNVPTGGDPPAPHALGVIHLQETHVAGGSVSTPSVAAAFAPLDLDPHSCTEAVGACEVQRLPECGMCAEGEFCAFDDACTPTCTRACALACDPGELCQLDEAGTPECVTPEAFDGGALVFTGTAIPITLFPPYVFDVVDTGSPFAPAAEISVTASGATAAGFAAFEKTTVATTLVQSTLEDLTREQVLTAPTIAIGWGAGSDELRVEGAVQGPDGITRAFHCEADDAAGAFALERAVLTAASGGGTPVQISLAVHRRRSTTYEDLRTVGTLSDVDVPIDAWLRFSTASLETRSFEGCPAGSTACGDACVYTNEDRDHCGGCDIACDADEQCEAGECVFDDGCKGPTTLCAGECVDTDTSVDHCGDCDDPCAPFESCADGHCEPPGGDGNYPPGGPGCPEPYVTTFGVCAPPCDGGCPEGETGTADPQCLIYTGGDLETPTHCALVCAFGQTCPDTMTCDEDLGICTYDA